MVNQEARAEAKDMSIEGNDDKNDGEGERITSCTRGSEGLDEKIEEIRGETNENILKG